MKANNLKRLSVVLALALFTLAPNANALTGVSNNGDDKKEKKDKDGNGNNGNGLGNYDGDATGEDEHEANQGNGKTRGNTGPRDGDSIPLDGGLSILLVGAAVFGMRKLRKK